MARKISMEQGAVVQLFKKNIHEQFEQVADKLVSIVTHPLWIIQPIFGSNLGKRMQTAMFHLFPNPRFLFNNLNHAAEMYLTRFRYSLSSRTGSPKSLNKLIWAQPVGLGMPDWDPFGVRSIGARGTGFCHSIIALLFSGSDLLGSAFPFPTEYSGIDLAERDLFRVISIGARDAVFGPCVDFDTEIISSKTVDVNINAVASNCPQFCQIM